MFVAIMNGIMSIKRGRYQEIWINNPLLTLLKIVWRHRVHVVHKKTAMDLEPGNS